MTPEGWRQATYGHAMSETDSRAGDAMDLPVLSVTKTRGLMLASERFGKVMHGRDLTRYRIAHRNTIVADPMLLWDGSIGLQTVVEAGLVSPDYRVYQPADDVAAEFLGYVVRSPQMLRHYQDGARGTNVRRNRIARSDFLAIPFAIPPLPEQKKIAAILSSIDDAIQVTQAVIDQLQVVKKSMMAELLTRGIPGRHTRFKKTEIGEVPEGWSVLGILDAVDLPSGQVDPRHAPYRDWVLIGPNHIESQTGRLIALESASDQRAISGKYVFQAGDVIYSKIRPYLRKAWLADRDGLCSADMYPLRPSSRVDGQFLLLSMLSERFSVYADSVSMRTGIPKLNREELAVFKLALPSLSEQREIGTVNNALAMRFSSEHLALAALSEAKSALMQVLLTGQLRVTPDEVGA